MCRPRFIVRQFSSVLLWHFVSPHQSGTLLWTILLLSLYLYSYFRAFPCCNYLRTHQQRSGRSRFTLNWGLFTVHIVGGGVGEGRRRLITSLNHIRVPCTQLGLVMLKQSKRSRSHLIYKKKQKKYEIVVRYLQN